MIRWNQAKIHQKRRERQDKIAALQLEISINKRVQVMTLVLDFNKGCLGNYFNKRRQAEFIGIIDQGYKRVEYSIGKRCLYTCHDG
jgi:hypothetical protein